MGIKIPDYRLAASPDLPQFRKRMGGKKSRSLEEEFSITSLLDVFATMLFYLMTTFSASGQMFLSDPNIKLPATSHGREMIRSPIITIFKEKIVIEGSMAGDNQGIIEKEEFNWELPLLAARLKEYKEFFERVQKGIPYPGDVVVQADKSLEFVYIKRVMFTLVKEGFGNINFVTTGAPLGPPLSAQPDAVDPIQN